MLQFLDRPISGWALVAKDLEDRAGAVLLLLLAAPLLLHAIFWFLSAPEPKFFLLAAWLFALCPALTFINQGMQVGFTSSIGNLCLNVLPVTVVLWEFRGTGAILALSPQSLRLSKVSP